MKGVIVIMNSTEITNFSLLKLFRQCSHLQFHRYSRFHGQGRILNLLKQNGVLTQKELISITQRRSATLSEQLEVMEKNGWIIREKNSTDKRNIDICLTPEGENIALEAQKEQEETANALFSFLEETEKAQLAVLLEKLFSHWQMDEKCSLQKREDTV